jgi:murein DD-endopeptidase MepM/ murein hydrolase activator NlpD
MMDISFKQVETLKNNFIGKLSNIKWSNLKTGNVYDIRDKIKSKNKSDGKSKNTSGRNTKKTPQQQKNIYMGAAGIIMLLILFVLIFTHKNAYEIYVGNTSVGIVKQNGLEEDMYNTAVAQIETSEGSKIKIDEGCGVTSKPVRAAKKEIVTTDYVISQMKQKMAYTIQATVLMVDGVEIGIVKNEAEVKAVTDKILSNYKLDNAEVVDKSFVEDIKTNPKFVTKAEIITGDDLYNKLTQKVQTEKLYTVKQGDTLWAIANSNGLSLKEMLKINPNITENTILKLGQQLMLVLPKPLLSVKVVSQIKYTENVPRSVEYETDAAQLKTYRQTKQEGEDGTKEVTANIVYVDGYEDERAVVAEAVVKEPISDIIVTGTMAIPAKAATGNFSRPISGGILSSGFGYRWGTLHAGVDLAAPRGTTIYASDGGTVKSAGWSGALGYLVIIDHGNGFETYYGHCSAIYVTAGQKVAKGEKISAVGSTGDSTGNHVHFEVHKNGTAYDPLNYIK